MNFQNTYNIDDLLTVHRKLPFSATTLQAGHFDVHPARCNTRGIQNRRVDCANKGCRIENEHWHDFLKSSDHSYEHFPTEEEDHG